MRAMVNVTNDKHVTGEKNNIHGKIIKKKKRLAIKIVINVMKVGVSFISC